MLINIRKMIEMSITQIIVVEDFFKNIFFILKLRKDTILNKKTRGPRGPWVAHLRKRSKVTV